MSGIARAGGDRDRAEHHGRERDAGRFLRAFAHADGMAAGDVAELVRDHALQLVDVVGVRDAARS